MEMNAALDAPASEECGACGNTFATLAEVFSHPCPEAASGYHDEPVTTNRADNVDRPDTNGSGGGAGSNRPDRSNRYPGPCVKCGHQVEAEAGLLVKDHAGNPGGRRTWGVEHRPGGCIEGPLPEPAGNVEEIRAAGLKPNRFPGNCTRCGARIEADQGVCEKQGGRWTVTHFRTDDCTPAEASAEPEVEVDDEVGPGYWVHPDSERVAEVVESQAGRLYAKALNPDTGHFDYEQGLIREIRAGGWEPLTVEAAAALGRRFGRCMVCGRALTNETSVTAGIGPVCAGRL